MRHTLQALDVLLSLALWSMIAAAIITLALILGALIAALIQWATQ